MSLEADLEQFIQKSGSRKVSLAGTHLGSGREILIQPDVSFHPASTFKLCLMMEVYHQARLGRLSLEDPIRIKNEFSSIADGSPYSLSVEDDSEKDLYRHIGLSLPLRELTYRMIAISSNLATNLLIEQVTAQQTTQFMRELGADSLVIRRGVEDAKAFHRGLNNAASARGFQKILVKLARREILCEQDSNEMIDLLNQQQFSEMMPAQLPAGTRVAHKTGWNADLYHDVGIIYPQRGEPIVLAILTDGIQDEQSAHIFIASLARKVYDALQK